MELSVSLTSDICSFRFLEWRFVLPSWGASCRAPKSGLQVPRYAPQHALRESYCFPGKEGSGSQEYSPPTFLTPLHSPPLWETQQWTHSPHFTDEETEAQTERTQTQSQSNCVFSQASLLAAYMTFVKLFSISGLCYLICKMRKVNSVISQVPLSSKNL